MSERCVSSAEAVARLERLAALVVTMDAAGVSREVAECLADGLSPAQIVSAGLSAGMRRVGEMFKEGTVYMPEVLVSCDAYYKGLEVVRPLLTQTQENGGFGRGKMVLGTIHGDIHTVGKDVAIPVFQAAGFEVIDLGVDVSDDAFVDAIREHQPDVVGLGTYMTSTFMHTGATVDTIRRAGLRDCVKVICGGPAVDAAAAQRMGADDASDDAWAAVDKIGRLVKCVRANAGGRTS